MNENADSGIVDRNDESTSSNTESSLPAASSDYYPRPKGIHYEDENGRELLKEMGNDHLAIGFVKMPMGLRKGDDFSDSSKGFNEDQIDQRLPFVDILRASDLAC